MLCKAKKTITNIIRLLDKNFKNLFMQISKIFY